MIRPSPHRRGRRFAGPIAAIVLGLILALGIAAPPDASALPILSGVAATPRGDGTRVSLELNAPVAFRVFALADPPRIVIDLDEVTWAPPQRRLAIASGIVARVRYGVFRPGTSRVVLDCTAPARVLAARLARDEHTGHRKLLVDVGPATPLRKAGADSPAQPAAGAAQTALAPALAILATARPMRKPEPPFRPLVAIDPGHGGVDPGAISVSGQREKDITLAAARLLREALLRRGGYRVVLTRDRDIFIRLRDRIAIARAAGADVFLSLHADANPVASLRGASVYTLSERASDAEAAALAERENKVDLIAGLDLTTESPEVTNILIDLAQRETMNHSAQLASRLVGELGETTRLLRNTHRFAGFAVLKSPDVPSVLVEVGLLSNSEDDRLLRRRDHLEALAKAMVRALDAYFASVQVARAED